MCLIQTKAFIVLRGMAGSLLIVASCLKAHQLLTGPVSGEYWWDARPWQALAVGGELLLAGWMWSGLAPQLTRIFGLGIFSMFSIMTLIKALGGETSCGCFGELTVSPWITLGIDLALWFGFALIRPVSKSIDQNAAIRPQSWLEPVVALPWALVVLAGVVGGTLSFWTLTTEPARLQADTGELLGDGDFVLLEPEEWIGRPFPLFSYTDLPESVYQGNWWIMLYSPNCAHCIETIPKIEAIAQTGQQVVLLSMPPHDTREVDFSDGVVGRLNSTRDWFAQTPVLVEIENGVVIRAANGPQADDWF